MEILLRGSHIFSPVYPQKKRRTRDLGAVVCEFAVGKLKATNSNRGAVVIELAAKNWLESNATDVPYVTKGTAPQKILYIQIVPNFNTQCVFIRAKRDVSDLKRWLAKG